MFADALRVTEPPAPEAGAAALLDHLWRDHVELSPQSARIHQLLTAHGELLAHDHLAVVTFAVDGLGLAALAAPFEARGWQPREPGRPDGDHLRSGAWHHPDPALPKLVLSELAVDGLSPAAQATIGRLVGQLPPGFAARDGAMWGGRPWQLCLAEYEALAAESAHAAWLAAFGFRVRHFAVDLDSLATFPDLAAFAAFLHEHGFKLDDCGGLIKGSPAARLERLATRDAAALVAFSDTTARVPGCCYHAARRYPLPSGERFHGFWPDAQVAQGISAGTPP